MLELTAGPLRLQVAPAVGGSLARFDGAWHAGGRSGRVDWLRPASAHGLARGDPLAMASFPLVPFCNRIRHGRASFEGRELRFPSNHPAQASPHPLHGIGWQRPWTVTLRGDHHASLRLEASASPAWPWRFCAEQHLELTPQQLRVTMTVTNLDTAAMPAGIGHHPYFPHPSGTRLTSPAAAMWVGDAEVMPTALEVTDAVAQLREGVLLSQLDLDNNFVGWEHRTLVEWPLDAQGPRRSLLMEAQAPLDYFVLYCPRGADHFCAEPVSQCTDWLNLLPEYGRGPLGGARLEPGATLEARFTLSPRWD
ncbi:aldose 1-epimerase [Ramlibacter sp.]|uniref:aldose 1-epimerase n=1 Tax=Ramlibacter sp. TaxID=1917967 RepID=UPI002C605A8F|nr:aldose 1-epimerase [Ramlibacter sp.]HWI80788.1 aldose 1-epimerase [Ramlibacter sp.]